MCGISCIVTLQKSRHKPKEPASLPNGIQAAELNGDADHNRLAKKLDASLEMIKHRGPDSRGQWISEDNRVGPPTLTLLPRITCNFANAQSQHSGMYV